MAVDEPVAPVLPPVPQTTDEIRVALHTRLGGPVRDLSLLAQSLLFAELSNLAYYRHDIFHRHVSTWGFEEVRFFDREGAQAYLLMNSTDCVVACRGTEAHEWNDIKADANAVAAVAETVGLVHSGFKAQADQLWPLLEEALGPVRLPVWFTGHSLGGALATILAGRCKLSPIECFPEGLFTYGSPRVGNREYVTHPRITHVRWVNNNDVVTRVPPAWLGYRHFGREMYLNHRGRIRRLTGWQRLKDRLRGLWGGLREGRVDYLSDHSIDRYIEHVRHAVEVERTTGVPPIPRERRRLLERLPFRRNRR